jgi:phenylacetic acid degradation operon negative regulatory protein
MKLEYQILFQFLLCGLETFSRRDCAFILAGFHQTASDRELDRLLDRWRNRELIAREGHGQSARFKITDAGLQHVPSADPARDWDRSWDGIWRGFSFDLPSRHRRDRMVLWRTLRAHKLGLLQRSVWVWPHEVETMLRETIQAHGIPECFCGFRSNSLFLCNDSEVVAAAWDWEEIGRRHETYLRHQVADTESLERARDLRELARIARVELDAFAFAFSLDPLLPRVLLPRAYLGQPTAARRHAFRHCLRRRLSAMSS